MFLCHFWGSSNSKAQSSHQMKTSFSPKGTYVLVGLFSKRRKMSTAYKLFLECKLLTYGERKRGKGGGAWFGFPPLVTLLPILLCSAFLVLDAKSFLLRKQIGSHARGSPAYLRAYCVQVWFGACWGSCQPFISSHGNFSFHFLIFLVLVHWKSIRL